MKTRNVLLFAALLLGILLPATTFAQTCVTLPAGAVGWWQGESNAYDVVTGSRALLAGPSTYTPGEVGTGFSFNGYTGGLLIGAVAAANTNAFTIEAWVQRSDTSFTSHSSVGGGTVMSHGANSWALVIADDGTLYVTQVGVNQVNSTLRVTDLNFHHVAAASDGQTVFFYLDGVADTPVTYAPPYSFAQGLAVGANPAGDAVFLGVIDEATIYNRVLSSDEINSIYQAGGAGKCAPLTIVSQPSDFKAQPGATAIFQVVAVGGQPLSYQWESNSVPIDGAINATLIVPHVTLDESGASYSVLVSNTTDTVLSDGATLTVAVSACDPPLAGLVGWWPADGSTTDATGRNDGVFTGTATYVPGVNDTAFSFTNEGDSVLIGDAPELQLQSFTIAAWIQRTDPQAVTYPNLGGGLVFSYGANGYGFGLVDSGALILSDIGVNGVTSTAGITDLQYHQVVVTTQNAITTFYIDGQPVTTNDYGPNYSFNTPAAIGCRGDGIGTFLGSIDDVSVYNRPLTGAEILTLYNRHAELNCIAAPVIVTQPTNQTNIAGVSISFDVGVASVPATTYQWQLNGTNVPGATNEMLTFVPQDNSQAGNYSVIVSNSIGSTVSSNALLDLVQAVSISNQPQSQVAVLDANTTFSVLALGAAPVTYQWQFMGTNLPGATNTSYTVTNVTLSNLGLYQVFVTNPWSAMGSDIASLALNPEITINGQLGTNFSFTNTTVTVEISTTFTNGSIFYTLDGSTPDFNSTFYSGPFNLLEPAVVQAVAYDTNFNSAESFALNVNVLISNALTVANRGGGTVTLDPPGGLYHNTQTVQVTATPADGWVFMNWSGTVSGTNSVIDVSMISPQTVRPVFGTFINVKSPLTNGSIVIDPPTGPYPAGLGVPIIAIPAPGYALSLWGGSLSGQINPNLLTVNTANPTVSALFSSLPTNHFTLIVIPNGNGTARPFSSLSSFTSNAIVTVSATPNIGAHFYYWSGSVTSTSQQIGFTMKSNVVLTANFSGGIYPVQFSAPQVASNKVSFSLQGLPQQIYEVDVSSNLVDWSFFERASGPTGAISISDSTTNGATRYYRAFTP